MEEGRAVVETLQNNTKIPMLIAENLKRGGNVVMLEGMMTSVKEMTDKYDLMLYIANMGTKSNQTAIRIEWAQPMGANVPVYIETIPTVFISIENPYHLLDVPRVKTYINTYASTGHDAGGSDGEVNRPLTV